MRKWLSTSLVLGMGLSIFLSGCGGSKSGDSNDAAGGGEGSKAAGEKQVKFSFFSNSDQADMPWGQDPVSQWIEKNKNVSIEYVPSNGNAKQKLNTLLVGNDLPDVLRLGNADVQRFVDAGKLVALDDFIKADSNINEWVGKDVIDMLRSPDGKLYMVPNWFVQKGNPNGNGGWIINKKIYKELGSPKLETTEDLESYLRLVKEKKPDIIPLEMTALPYFNSFVTFYSAFGENRPSYFFDRLFYQDGNQLKPITDDPAFVEATLTASRLFRDKLITQDAFTQKWDQVVEKISQERVAVLACNNVFAAADAANSVLRKQDPDAGYDIIWPIHKAGLDKSKIWPNTYNRLGGGGAVITKSAKDPKALFEYIDWVLGAEGQKTLWYGPPGLYWDKADGEGVPIPNDAYAKSTSAERTKQGLQGHFLIGNSTYIDKSKVKREQQLPEAQRDWVTMAQVNIAWKTSYDVTQFANTDPATNSDEGIIAQSVRDIFDQAFAQMIYAKGDDEVLGLIAKAKADINNAGYDKVLKFKEKVWNENKKKLGIS